MVVWVAVMALCGCCVVGVLVCLCVRWCVVCGVVLLWWCVVGGVPRCGVVVMVCSWVDVVVVLAAWRRVVVGV